MTFNLDFVQEHNQTIFFGKIGIGTRSELMKLLISLSSLHPIVPLLKLFKKQGKFVKLDSFG